METSGAELVSADMLSSLQGPESNRKPKDNHTVPVGKPELRLYRVEIPAGGKIPLHTHPAPMMVYVQGVRSGSLLNTRVQPDGTEIKAVFKPGEAFVEGANEPHYVENIGEEPTIVWVTVASIEGMPTTEFIDK